MLIFAPSNEVALRFRSLINRDIRYVAAGALAITLAACATQPDPQVIYKDHPIPIPVQCKVDPEPHKPTLPDPTTAPDIFEAAKRAKARDKLQTGYIGELESAYQTCTGHPVPGS